MPTFSEILPAQKSSKHNCIKWTPTTPGQGVITIHTARNTTEYHVQSIPSDFAGKAFILSKLDGSERYAVLCGAKGEHDRCDCAGHCYRPNQPCKHISACRAILDNEFLWAEKAAPVPTPEEALDALTLLLFGKPAAKPAVEAKPRANTAIDDANDAAYRW